MQPDDAELTENEGTISRIARSGPSWSAGDKPRTAAWLRMTPGVNERTKSAADVPFSSFAHRMGLHSNNSYPLERP
jgi:hypothetical protein